MAIFSTKAGGSGLKSMLVRNPVIASGGELEPCNHQTGGATVAPYLAPAYAGSD